MSPSGALGRDLRRAEAPVEGVGAAGSVASFTVWLITLLQVRASGARDSPVTEGLGQGLPRHVTKTDKTPPFLTARRTRL